MYIPRTIFYRLVHSDINGAVLSQPSPWCPGDMSSLQALQRTTTTGSLPGPSRPLRASNAAPALAGSLRLPTRAGSLHFGPQKPR